MNPKDRHCYGCKLRSIHCHEHCTMWQEDDAAHKADLERIRKAKADEEIQTAYISEQHAAEVRRKRYKR